MMDCWKKLLIVFLAIVAGGNVTLAQTDLHISGPQAGFPIAVPKLCDLGNGEVPAGIIPDSVTKNLLITGIFRVLQPSSFVETSGKCSATGEFSYSDWSVIGADWLVRGEVGRSSPRDDDVVVRLYLYDIVNKRAALGKQYQAEVDDIKQIADKFSNEILRLFTGSPGIFGTKIVYVSRVGRFKELFLMDIDGSNQRQLTQDKGLAISPAWSQSGDRIVYTSYRTRQPELFILPVNGGQPSQITRRAGLELGAEFSPDGSSLLSSASIAGDSHLVFFDFRGQLTRQLTQGASINVSPHFSPDGKKIVYCSNRSGGPQIYLSDSVGGGTPTRISFTNSSYCTSPVWSPKGDKILFVCRNDGGNQLYVSGVDGSATVQLTFTGSNEDPSWAPDGNFIVYSSNVSGVRNIYVLSVLTGTTRQVTFSKSDCSQPVWSPFAG